MRLRQHPIPLSILLLQLLSLAHGTPQADVADVADRAFAREVPSTATLDTATAQGLAAVGKKDAPVDGKDGLPHAGPFVETAAQRDRKKAQESGDDDSTTAVKKPGPSDSQTNDGWNKAMPVSNDGVMDDPNRVGPKEGTRGTEGGISEKSRDKSGGLNGAEKTPEEPKEAPPLPHSEQEKLSVGEDRVLKTDVESKPSADAVKSEELELGGLTVSVIIISYRYKANSSKETRRFTREASRHSSSYSNRKLPKRPS